MAFRLLIDHDKLTDSPFKEGNQGSFRFPVGDTTNLAEDIVKGNRTCYMISGYRGSGKSSFIKRLESRVRVDLKSPERIFVYVNLAKREPRAIILRKLIRNFYQQLTDKADYKNIYDLIKVNAKVELADFKELYDHTFYEVSGHLNVKNTNKQTTTRQWNSKEIMLSILAAGAFLVFAFKMDTSKFSTYAAMLLSLLVAGLPLLKQLGEEKKEEAEHEKVSQQTKTSFYDDEISEYRLHKVICSLLRYIKPVFVIDELDKISDPKLVESTLNELKPLMLSGDASFIIVAGQQLYYNYYYSRTKDDHSLSSIFSRMDHVELHTSSELKLLFNQLSLTKISELTSGEAALLDNYLSAVIFKARNVPRSFISILRQRLMWENGEAFLFIGDSENSMRYADILNRVENHKRTVVLGKDYPPAIRDFINMKLMIEVDNKITEQIRK